MGAAGGVTDGDAVGGVRASRRNILCLAARRIDGRDVADVGDQIVWLWVLTEHERRLRHPVFAQVLVVVGLVDEDVAVDVDHAVVAGGQVELRVADRLARRRAGAKVVAVLAVVDLGEAAALDIDGIAVTGKRIRKNGVGLGVRAGLGGRGRHDRDLAEAKHLDEGRHGVVGHRHLDLLVVVAHRRYRRDRVATLGVSDGVVNRRGIER